MLQNVDGPSAVLSWVRVVLIALRFGHSCMLVRQYGPHAQHFMALKQLATERYHHSANLTVAHKSVLPDMISIKNP